MSNELYDFNLGHSTAYAYAKASGDLPEGMTPDEYGELLAAYATVGQTAVDAKDAAVAANTAAQTAATTATNKASEATTAATTATNKAAEAQADADAAALDASQALSAASTATSKATEATTAAATATSAATTATTAKDDAVSAKTAAETAQAGAETAAASVQSSAAQIATNTSDISELKEDLTASPISLGTPTTGSIYKINTSTMAVTVDSASGRLYPVIDLSDYIGYNVIIKMSTTNTGDRACAICDANGVASEYLLEGTLAKIGKTEFTVTSTYKYLYISYSTMASNVSVSVYDPNTIYGVIDAWGKSTVYVSATKGNDDNVGTVGAPLHTLQKAIMTGAENIYVEPGEYAGFNVVNRKKPLNIALWEYPAWSASALAKIKITSATSLSAYSGVVVNTCGRVTLSDVWVDGVERSPFNLVNCDFVELNRCIASNNSVADWSGFRFQNSNGVCRDCIAHDVTLDGFNVHFYGNVDLINCKAYNCGDDGASHHERTSGCIIGGEFYNNGKAGVAPFSGCDVNIYNVYSHDNAQYGAYVASDSTHPNTTSILSGCAFKGNGTTDIFAVRGTANVFNCIYDTSTTGTNGTINAIS